MSGRRPLNRFELEPKPKRFSTSARKLKYSEDFEKEIEVKDTFSYLLLTFFSVFNSLSKTSVCKTCHYNIKFTESDKRGLGFEIVVSCGKYEQKIISSRHSVGNAFEVNCRMTLAMRLIGIG